MRIRAPNDGEALEPKLSVVECMGCCKAKVVQGFNRIKGLKVWIQNCIGSTLQAIPFIAYFLASWLVWASRLSKRDTLLIIVASTT